MSADPVVTLPVPRETSKLRETGVPAELSQRVLVLESEGPNGLWCTTKGLSEFGLPELQTLDVPPEIGVAWAGVLTGMALRLIERWIAALQDSSAAFVELSALIDLTSGDVARAYGQRDDGDGERARVQLRLDPASDMKSDSFLTVGPPDGAPGPAAQYLLGVCSDLFRRFGR